MPASTPLQAYTAKKAIDVKTGKASSSDVTSGAVNMSKMPMKTLKHFTKLKEHMTEGQKKRLLTVLKKLKEEYTGNVGGETDIVDPDNPLVNEDGENAQHHVIAKTFDTKADFDSYVNQRRGIEMTPLEQQSIVNYKDAKPTQQDKFLVKYENTDSFGNNTTTVVKKLKEGNQYCWTAFQKHETAQAEGNPEGQEGHKEPEEMHEQDEVTVDDPIRITKTITFVDETDGSNILSDFLRELGVK